MDLVDASVLAAAIGSVVVIFALSNVYFKQAIAKAQRSQTLELMLKQLNIKDFHVKDLNADKLDDRGFMRLMTMLTVMFQQKQGGGWTAQLAQIKADTDAYLQQLKMLGTPGQQPAPNPYGLSQ